MANMPRPGAFSDHNHPSPTWFETYLHRAASSDHAMAQPMAFPGSP